MKLRGLLVGQSPRCQVVVRLFGTDVTWAAAGEAASDDGSGVSKPNAKRHRQSLGEAAMMDRMAEDDDEWTDGGEGRLFGDDAKKMKDSGKKNTWQDKTAQGDDIWQWHGCFPSAGIGILCRCAFSLGTNRLDGTGTWPYWICAVKGQIMRPFTKKPHGITGARDGSVEKRVKYVMCKYTIKTL